MKKTLIAIAFIVFALSISTVCSYAQSNNSVLDNIGNSIRNTVGGAENTVEGAAKGASDAAKNGTNALTDNLNKMTEDAKKGAQNAGNAVKNGTEDAGNAVKDAGNNVKNGTENMMNGMTGGTGNYTASRTAADGGSANAGFMNTETWSWIIIGVVAIAIIALFWYYAAHTKNDRNHHN